MVYRLYMMSHWGKNNKFHSNADDTFQGVRMVKMNHFAEG